jgi:protein phosphatase
VDWVDILEEAGSVLDAESRLIQLPPQRRAVFVGDTHGDLDASRQVVRRFLKKPDVVVFLGDYVDRGSFSKENLFFLLQMKQEHPEDLFLLAGNHEGYPVREFYPANFWESLAGKEFETLARLVCKFPLAATSENGILALHGALPELNSLDEVNRIESGDSQWERVLWGDFVESGEDRMEDWGGRPQFGRPYFDRLMERYRKKILLRSHQPLAPMVMFDKRCVTLFTSSAYVSNRTVAIVDLDREIRNAEDVTFEKI